MATVSNTPRPGYAWDATDNCWYPIGTGPHTHADYITSSSAINPTIVDAKGDIIAATAADTVARLAVGANDTVLTADSSTATGLKWATPAAGGMTLLSTTTLTGASVSITSISGAYKNLTIFIEKFLPATDDSQLYLRFNNDTGNSYATTGNSFSTTAQSFSADSVILTNGQDNAVSQSFINIVIPNYTNANTWKIVQNTGFTNNATDATQFNIVQRTNIWNGTAAINRIDLYASSGNLTSGTVYIYGVK